VRYFNGKPVAHYDFDHRAASAVYTSAHELVRFGMFHLKNHLRDQRPILKDATIDAMQRVTTPGDPTSGYGLGWSMFTESGKRVVSHTGGMPGVATTLKLFPDHDVAITVLGNGSGGLAALAPHRAALIVADAVLPNHDAVAAANRAAAQGPVAFGTPSSMWGEWTGTVRTYDGATTPIAMLIKPDDVHVRIGGRDALWTVLNGPSFRNDLLGGRFVGQMPSPEARRFPHDIGVSLLLRDGKLQGWASALTTDDPPTGAMSSYVELTKREGAPRP
jgi:hypothetical protein